MRNNHTETKLFTGNNIKNILSYYSLVEINSDGETNIVVYPSIIDKTPEQRDYIYACHLCKMLNKKDPAKVAGKLLSHMDFDIDNNVDQKYIDLNEMGLGGYPLPLVIGFVKTAYLEQADAVSFRFEKDNDGVSFIVESDPFKDYASIVDNIANMLSVSQ